MEMTSCRPVENRRSTFLKAFILFALILTAYITVRHTPARHYLDGEVLAAFVDSAGFWAPAVFLLIYTVGVTLFVPATVFMALGAALFGPYWGFLYLMAGALCGATVGFCIARYLGRGFIASVGGPWLRKYDEAIARNGFATVLYLRLMYSPFAPVNFGMGLSKISFWDYFIGTALGISVETFVFSSLFGTLRQIWMSGNWQELFSLKVLSLLGLFAASFLIPVVVKKFSRRSGDV